MRLDHLACAADRFGCAVTADAVAPALRRFIADAAGTAIGIDAPVTLGKALIGGEGWAHFIRRFRSDYPDAEVFRAWCASMLPDERSARRACDIEARTPFAAHNLRLYRQTWASLFHLLAPLAGCIAVPPLTEAHADRPWLLETCPASTLLHLGLREPYKGPGEAKRRARARILDALVEAKRIVASPSMRNSMIADPGGDALDAAIAAATAARTVAGGIPPAIGDEMVEGRVFYG